MRHRVAPRVCRHSRRRLHTRLPTNWRETMNHVKWGFLIGGLLALSGCGKPVPVDKKAYVGEWQEKTMYVLITQDGSVRYKRLKGGASTSVEGPLKGFTGDNFE